MLYSRSRSKKKAEYSGSDRAIVAASIAGDQASFRELVTRHKTAVYSLILRQIGDAATAEELAQEVFVKAFMNIKSFRFESAFSTWLIRIALNHTNSYLSSRAEKQRRRTDPMLNDMHADGSDDPEKSYQKAQRMKRFREALSHLSPKLRSALILCGIEGKSYEEAADILQIPVGTVRSRLNHARLEMKKALFEENE